MGVACILYGRYPTCWFRTAVLDATGTIPEELGGLTALQDLGLSFNQLTGETT